MSKKTPVVIDSGEHTIKGGLAGDDEVKVKIPALVSRPKIPWAQKATAKEKPEDILRGSKAAAADPIQVNVKSPISRGRVDNWDDLERLWQLVYSECAVKSVDRPVLLAETPLNPVSCRGKAGEIFFEKFGASAMHFVPSASLALYSTGMTTGVVLDCGEGATHAVPVFEGFLLREAVGFSAVGGGDVSRHLQQQLTRQGYSFTTATARDVIRNYKETECYIAEDRAFEESKAQDSSAPAKLFKLPDGTGMIPIGLERFRAPDVLFSPSVVGLECLGVKSLLSKAVQSCDISLRKTLWSQIVFAGGSTLMKGFGSRVLADLRSKDVPRDVKIRISMLPNRQYASWIGGSIVGSLASFDKLAISKVDYAEEGMSAFREGRDPGKAKKK